MAYYIAEGFDHYNSASTDLLQRSGRLEWLLSAHASFILGRGGYGKALLLSGNVSGSARLQGSIKNSLGGAIIGWAMQQLVSTGGDNASDLIILDNTVPGSDTQFSVHFDATSGVIAVNRDPVTTRNIKDTAFFGDNSLIFSGVFIMTLDGLSVFDAGTGGISFPSALPTDCQVDHTTYDSGANETTVFLTKTVNFIGIPAGHTIVFGKYLGGTAGAAYSPFTYNYFEVSFSIGTVGYVQIKVNGETVLTVTGNTQVSPNPIFNGLGFDNGGTNASGGGSTVDDMYILDFGPGSDDQGPDKLILIPWTPTSSFTAISVGCIPADTNSMLEIVGAIYADSGGAPGALLATGVPLLGCVEQTQLISALVTPLPVTSGTPYWIGFNYNLDTTFILSDVGLNGVSVDNPFSGGLPNPAPVMDTGKPDWTIVINSDFPQRYDYYLGDVSVDTVFPTANVSVAWTPLANTNWQEVSEVVFDGDTSYNYTSGVGDVDLFAIGPVRTNIATVLAVQITGAYRKDDATSHIIEQQLKSGATQVDGDGNSVPSGYVFFTDSWIQDPNTGLQWLAADVNALNIGYKLIT